MKTLPDDAQTHDLPTDFTAFLADRRQLTPEAAHAKLGGWLMNYVPLKVRDTGEANGRLARGAQRDARAERGKRRSAA